MSIKSFIRETFRSCLDILRDSEHLIGDKALRPLGYFLLLRLLESKFGKEIDIDNSKYYNFSEYEFANNKELCDKHLGELLRLARFSYLAKVKEDNLKINLQYLWDDILSVHPATKEVFLKGRGFQLKRQSTYKKIIDKLAAVNFESIDEDILGEAYEEVMKDVMTGKTLGQFFTPPVIKQMMIQLIDPQIYQDGTTESIFDPAMGTGGFLITCLRSLINKSRANKIPLNWEHITKNRAISGRECEPDTFQLAVSNMLISSGKKFGLEHGDSIRDPISAKYDIILANPPFGIKGLDYDEIKTSSRNSYLPIKSNSSTPLFLQAIICMLKVNGRCAVVLPDGQDLFSKSKSLVAVREYLMKTCDLKEVIYLPPGMFTHTSIKTCVFYFYKRKEGNEVVELKIKRSDVKETDRSYVFTEAHRTEKVVFSEFDGVAKRILAEVGIADIAKNNYSLNFSEYLEKPDSTIKNGGGSGVSSNIVVKTLGEICKFDIGGTPSRSVSEYYENGSNLWVSVSELNRGYIYESKEKITDAAVQNSSVKLFPKDTVLFSFKLSIGKTAIVGTPLYTNEAIAGIFSKTPETLCNKYLYHYLSNNDFTNFASGLLGKGSLNKKSLAEIKIPVPPMEKQKEIVERLDFILELCNPMSRAKIDDLRKLNNLRFQTSDVLDAPVKTLGEVCKVNQGTYIKPDMKINGEYPVYGGGNISFFINSFNRENEIVVAKDGVSADCVRYVSGKFFLNHHGWTIACKEMVNKKYMFYVLYSVKSQLLNIAKGTAQLGINQENFYKLTIPLPSLEQQQEIVEFCEANDALIKQLEKEIEQNDKLAKTFLETAHGQAEATHTETEDESKKRKR